MGAFVVTSTIWKPPCSVPAGRIVVCSSAPRDEGNCSRRTALLRIAAPCLVALAPPLSPASATPDPANDFYALSPNQDGKPTSLGYLRGSVTLVVNVATYCALTPQYASLVALHEKFIDRGFEVLAFPCNQFGRQEPGTRDEICEFAKTQFGAKFTILDKVEVNGPGESPEYRMLKRANPQSATRIEWNFAKFLVDKDGTVVRRYKPGVDPLDIVSDVDALVNNKALPAKRKPQLGAV